ncbi:hypothetical protein B0H15DRAFT_993499 [Mycena belliarum]|uniref:Uncharacterized protein n=1 Tax=Mycena belliarum TaxID=1033014 RepID=A0AAD6XLE0_9AGAR|nr:hypothetical protein B0H15DRAFT_993499 [Mycena belliae]
MNCISESGCAVGEMGRICPKSLEEPGQYFITFIFIFNQHQYRAWCRGKFTKLKHNRSRGRAATGRGGLVHRRAGGKVERRAGFSRAVGERTNIRTSSESSSFCSSLCSARPRPAPPRPTPPSCAAHVAHAHTPEFVVLANDAFVMAMYPYRDAWEPAGASGSARMGTIDGGSGFLAAGRAGRRGAGGRGRGDKEDLLPQVELNPNIPRGQQKRSRGPIRWGKPSVVAVSSSGSDEYTLMLPLGYSFLLQVVPILAKIVCRRSGRGPDIGVPGMVPGTPDPDGCMEGKGAVRSRVRPNTYIWRRQGEAVAYRAQLRGLGHTAPTRSPHPTPYLIPNTDLLPDIYANLSSLGLNRGVPCQWEQATTTLERGEAVAYSVGAELVDRLEGDAMSWAMSDGNVRRATGAMPDVADDPARPRPDVEARYARAVHSPQCTVQAPVTKVELNSSAVPRFELGLLQLATGHVRRVHMTMRTGRGCGMWDVGCRCGRRLTWKLVVELGIQALRLGGGWLELGSASLSRFGTNTFSQRGSAPQAGSVTRTRDYNRFRLRPGAFPDSDKMVDSEPRDQPARRRGHVARDFLSLESPHIGAKLKPVCIITISGSARKWFARSRSLPCALNTLVGVHVASVPATSRTFHRGLAPKLPHIKVLKKRGNKQRSRICGVSNRSAEEGLSPHERGPGATPAVQPANSIYPLSLGPERRSGRRLPVARCVRWLRSAGRRARTPPGPSRPEASPIEFEDYTRRARGSARHMRRAGSARYASAAARERAWTAALSREGGGGGGAAKGEGGEAGNPIKVDRHRGAGCPPRLGWGGNETAQRIHLY